MGNRAPRVSVIIPNYNGRHLLDTCLGSLSRQTFSDLETTLVDDGSRDDSVAWTLEHFTGVRVECMGRNRGMDITCNRGAAVSRGAILVMLNSDTEAEPGWLAALVAALDANPRAGAAASKMLLFDQRQVLHTAGDMMGVDGIPRNRGAWEKDEGQYDRSRDTFGACGGGVAYRRLAWEAVGGFDPDLFMYLEDVDFAWRMQLLGWEAVFAPDARLYHRLSATSGGKLASYLTGRNTLWVIAKDMPAALFRRHWRRVIGAQLRITRDALRSWRGVEARHRLWGQAVGMMGLPYWLLKRRALQRSAPYQTARLERLLVP
jgi:GT2 family glycosyltransferase